MHHSRTRKLQIEAPMWFDRLPSNWVNWRLQGRFHSPYATESHVTGKAEAGPFPEVPLILIWQAQLKLRSQIHPTRMIHIYQCHWWQFQLQLPSGRPNGLIYGMEDVTGSPQWQRQSYKAIYSQRVNESTMITNMISGIIGLSIGAVQVSGPAITDRVAASLGKYNHHWMFESGKQACFAVTIVNYHNQHLIGWRNGIVVRRESHLD